MATIAQYDVGQKIGSGGFANVYRARNRALNAFVAVKIITKASIENNPTLYNRVLAEISIHTKLTHPNIVRITSIFEDTRNIYLAMDLCSHGNLYRYLMQRRGNPLTEAATSHIAKQLLESLEYLHNNHIVHRDLKLSNILISEIKEDLLTVKLCDFGLATALTHPDEEHFTFCGTPNYIAPEIAWLSQLRPNQKALDNGKRHVLQQRGRSHGTPVDIWSSGILCLSLLSGRPPQLTQSPNDSNNSNSSSILSSEHGSSHVSGVDYSTLQSMLPQSLSDTCREFVFSLLTQDPSKRPTAKAALQHPYVRPNRVSSLLSISPSSPANFPLEKSDESVRTSLSLTPTNSTINSITPFGGNNRDTSASTNVSTSVGREQPISSSLESRVYTNQSNALLHGKKQQVIVDKETKSINGTSQQSQSFNEPNKADSTMMLLPTFDRSQIDSKFETFNRMRKNENLQSKRNESTTSKTSSINTAKHSIGSSWQQGIESLRNSLDGSSDNSSHDFHGNSTFRQSNHSHTEMTSPTSKNINNGHVSDNDIESLSKLLSLRHRLSSVKQHFPLIFCDDEDRVLLIDGRKDMVYLLRNHDDYFRFRITSTSKSSRTLSKPSPSVGFRHDVVGFSRLTSEALKEYQTILAFHRRERDKDIAQQQKQHQQQLQKQKQKQEVNNSPTQKSPKKKLTSDSSVISGNSKYSEFASFYNDSSSEHESDVDDNVDKDSDIEDEANTCSEIDSQRFEEETLETIIANIQKTMSIHGHDFVKEQRSPMKVYLSNNASSLIQSKSIQNLWKSFSAIFADINSEVFLPIDGNSHVLANTRKDVADVVECAIEEITHIVDMIRSVTPRIIFYVKERETLKSQQTSVVVAKCMLMCNDPLPEFYVQFHDGVTIRYELESGVAKVFYEKTSSSPSSSSPSHRGSSEAPTTTKIPVLWEGVLQTIQGRDSCTSFRSMVPSEVLWHLRVVQFAVRHCLRQSFGCMQTSQSQLTSSSSMSLSTGPNSFYTVSTATTTQSNASSSTSSSNSLSSQLSFPWIVTDYLPSELCVKNT